MLRRLPALIAALTAALAMANHPSPSVAAALSSDHAFGTTTSFLLKNDGEAAVSDVYALITPAFKVAIPPQDHATDPSVLPFTRGPLVVRSGEGFDPASLVPHVSDEAAGLTDQLLWLEFPDGLQPGGFLEFELGSDPSYTEALSLTLVDNPQDRTPLTTGGVSLVAMTPVEANDPDEAESPAPEAPPVTSPPVSEVQVPEPLTLALWSTGALGLGLVRARSFRRGRPTAA